MKKTVFIERIESGYSNIKLLEDAVLSFPYGKRLAITISDKANRSSRQNNLLWLYATIISKELGYSKEEMFEIIKFKFLKREKVDENTGLVMEYIESTTKLSKEEFSELVDKLIIWCGQTFNISLPMPDEQTSLNV